ncbi:MAG TPA: 4-(cytidine 5'-diphospho)-2-C-methyl-D-erythritol kinase [Actinomycetota bacterium]|nr:4-(cytidine 5'-diphospho)-2-C-methyl-D-erythritol kinase [Actinomycetota bacterium]
MIEMRAYAKVNLFLAVHSRRPDGFHEIDTVLHGIDLADNVVVEERGTAGVEVRLVRGEGFEGALPAGDDELCTRAARALLGEAPGLGAEITITKRIPLGSGMGGGSADAAAVLRALDELWGLGLGVDGLTPIAARLGSDVPYFIRGGTARARGRGEVVEPLDAPKLWFVIGTSRDGLSTSAVYNEWSGPASAARTETTRPEADDLVAGLTVGDAEAIAAALRNDLEDPSFTLRPELRTRKDALAETGLLAALMSGSGPTIFGLCRSEAEARECTGRAAASFDRVLVASTAPPLD